MNLVGRRRALTLLLRMGEIERWEHLLELRRAVELRADELREMDDHLSVVEARGDLADLGPEHLMMAQEHGQAALAAAQTMSTKERALISLDARRRTLEDLRIATNGELARMEDRRQLSEVLDFFVARQIYNRQDRIRQDGTQQDSQERSHL
jgi:hypothetical protein